MTQATRAHGPDPAQVKQVIVIRRDLHMRRGKEIAQGAHASAAWLMSMLAGGLDGAGAVTLRLDPVARAWVTGSWRKVALQAPDEATLRALHAAARARGLRSHLVTDSGRTEFAGVPTLTALAIGPDLAADIDAVTGSLRLY
jgi:PTH2 family peptidyl-tRNA hydrolase